MTTQRVIRTAFALLLLLMSSGTGARADGALTFFRIGSGPTMETLYALSTSISAGISRPPGSLPCSEGGVCGVPGLIAVAQSRTGSIENIFAMMRGELDSAIIRADIAFQAYHGRGAFRYEGAQPDLRVIADLTPVSLHLVVRNRSDIQSVRDLRGKTVTVGARGSGTRSFALVVLRMHGMKPRDLTLRYYSPARATDALISKEVDAIFVVGAAPIQAISDLALTQPIRLIDLAGYARRQLISLYPFVDKGLIPAGTYRENQDIETVQMGVQWVVWKQADNNLIRDITRALWQSDTRDLFLRNNPHHRFPDIRSGVPEGGIPIHPGAAAYYQELGLVR